MKRRTLQYGTVTVRELPVIRWALIGLAVIACLYGAYLGCDQAMSPKVYQNVTSADVDFSLPSNATAINYQEGGALGPMPLIFECTTNATDFTAWASSKGRTVQTGSFSLYRYDGTKLEMSSGLYFTYLNPNNTDSGEHAMFDPSTGRMYYASHSR